MHMRVCMCVFMYEGVASVEVTGQSQSLLRCCLFSDCCFCFEAGSLMFSGDLPRRLGRVSKPFCLSHPGSGSQEQPAAPHFHVGAELELRSS